MKTQKKKGKPVGVVTSNMLRSATLDFLRAEARLQKYVEAFARQQHK